MAFAGAGSADQNRIALLGQETAVRQIAHQRLVDGRVPSNAKPSRSLVSGSLAMVI
jgi:hypothetical protein